MIRLNLTVEGHSEETFVRELLAPHLGQFEVFATARRVLTRRRERNINGHRGIREFRGGMPGYERVRGDLIRWMKEDQNADARFSTMFDLYGLHARFPEFDRAQDENDPREKVRVLEEAFARDIDDLRFIPYLQLHEFEALILSAPERFACFFLTHEREIGSLRALCDEHDSPEDIDDGPQTAPSKRIIGEIPEYADVKPTAGSIIANSIGLPKMREKCPHFDRWVTKLEGLKRED